MAGKIRVTPSELEAKAKQLTTIAENYTTIYNQLMQQAQTMGAAWEGTDNLAFVEQISGFCEDLKEMVTKLENASTALNTQAKNYIGRQDDNVMQVQKLAN